MRRKVLIRGPVLTQSGYGEHTRFVVKALAEYPEDFDLFLLPVNWGQTNWIAGDDEDRKFLDSLIQKTAFYTQNGGQFDLSLQVTIPNEWEKLAPVNIGVTAGIETTKVSPQWIEKSTVVDRIVTISEHSKNVYESTTYQAKTPQGEVVTARCNTPIDVVHYPVRDFEPADVGIDFEYDDNFLTVLQWSPRKNLENTIRWFVEENIDKEVGLVVKANIAKNCLIDRRHSELRLKQLLSKYPDRKCKVYLLHGYMSNEEMTALYQHPKIKAYVSLTHGEGYGLPLFEAAYNELPVVAPAWSGHVDFLYMPVEDKKGKKKMKAMFAKVDYTIQQIQPEARWEGVLQPDSMWCYPEQGSFKMKLREILKDYSRFKSQAKKLNVWIRENFKAEDKYLDMRNAVLNVYGTVEQEEQSIDIVMI
jgi:hypothetical protein